MKKLLLALLVLFGLFHSALKCVATICPEDVLHTSINNNNSK